MSGGGQRFFAEFAWVDGRWQREVLLEVDARGHWGRVVPGSVCPPDAGRLRGPVLPSLVNAHSHAFQRAFAGLAERRDSEADDFWSWRERMYGVALRITPAQLKAIARQLYLELLQGGYTHVCEFHYLQHAPDGRPYEDELAMAWALAEAAAEVGMGLTLLPVLYAHAGFAQRGLRDEQRRFATDARWVWQAAQRINAAGMPGVNAGVALHSLRAAHGDDVRALLARVGDADLPIHIHVAEQQREVQDCLAATGRRPIEQLCAAYRPDARWHLVHATHAMPAEIDAVAAAGAGIVVCPGTEANLGDGLCDLPRWLAAGVPISVGSDSQVTRAWPEELRWLEYGQRLALQQRNVAAAPSHQTATAGRLFEACRSGSAAPAGLARWGLQQGARADFLVLDAQASSLLGLPREATLDGLVFSAGADLPIMECWLAGRRLADACPPGVAARIRAEFVAAMAELHA